MDQSPMTPEYARLSLQAGYLAAAADIALGRACFSVVVRLYAWQLTPAFLEEIRTKAIEMGVPPSALEMTPEQLAIINDPDILSKAVEIQAESDRRLNAKRADQ